MSYGASDKRRGVSAPAQARELDALRPGVRRWWRVRSRRERGAALLSVIIVLVLMTTLAADLAYNTEVDLASAANARDDLRAYYLARSGINLSQLLLRVQQKIIDPNQKFLGGMDIQVSDYASLLVAAFNNKESAEMLGSFLGVAGGEIKGLGVDVGSFDLQMESLDGKLNINCGGSRDTEVLNRFAASFAAMILPARYNRLFEEPDEEGQYADRLAVTRAIIDWVDVDTVMFGSGAAEDYRYNTGKDPYEIKNQFFDTLEELRLVRGIDDDFMAAFSDNLTVYGDCKVNLNLADAPVLVALIMQSAATPTDPALAWDNLSLLSRYLLQIRMIAGGFRDVKSFIQAVESPMEGIALASAFDPAASENMQSGLPPVSGVKLNAKTVEEAANAGGPRRIWQVTASAEVGRIKKKISAVWDVKLVSMTAGRQNMGPGGYLYWREE